MADLPLYTTVARPTAAVVERWGHAVLAQLAVGVPAALALVGLAWLAIQRARRADAAEAALREEAALRAAAVGLEPERFAGHSPRARSLTSGAEAGVSFFKLMEVSRHRSADTLRGYVRCAGLFKDHAGGAFL